MNCIFACDGVECSNETTYSFKNIICNLHLKEVFGLKQWVFTSETESGTEYCGPFLIPDRHSSFKPNTVVLPTKAFLDHLLLPQKLLNADLYPYELNPRMKTYLNHLQMNRMKFKSPKTYRYHTELIRNLPEEGKVDLINQHDLAHADLKNYVRTRISGVTHKIESEPYYSNFDTMSVVPLNDPTVPRTLDQFSAFTAFLLYNCMFDKVYLPVGGAPLMCYPNLAYVANVGFVAIDDIKNNVPLTLLGDMRSTVAYFQQKTHVEPNQIVTSHFNKQNFPDTMRNVNVISSNERYC